MLGENLTRLFLKKLGINFYFSLLLRKFAINMNEGRIITTNAHFIKSFPLLFPQEPTINKE